MTHFAEAFAWCMLQVTVFSLAAACLYGVVVRFRLGSASIVLISSLAMVGLLTLACAAPWPRWFIRPEAATADHISIVSRDRSPIAAATEQGSQSIPLLARRAPTPDHSPKSNLPDGLGGENRHTSVLGTSQNHSTARSVSFSVGRQTAWPIILAFTAAIAAAVGVLRLIIGIITLQRYRRSSRPINDPAIQQLVAEFAAGFPLTRRVAVHECDSLHIAATAGCRRPLILLPAAWRAWTPDELRAVLAHELAHIHQRHFQIWVLSQLPLVAHYYHPLVHWLMRRLRLEQELAADELAARLFGRRSQYATMLAGLALGNAPPRGSFATLGLFMSRPFLMRRIAMLRQTAELNRFSRKSRMVVLLMLGLAAVSAAGLRSSLAEEPEEPAAGAAPLDGKSGQGSYAAPTGTVAPATPALAPMLVCPYLPGDAQRQPGAVALFQVSRTPPSLANTESEPESDQAWQVLCKTQLAKLKSHFVLSSALRKPDIVSMPLVRSQASPSDWLIDKLEVGFVPGSEIMYVRLSGKRDEIEQLTKLVDAVAEAYEDEVIFADTADQLTTRDLLAQTVKKLNEELTDKMQTYHNMAKEMGKLDSGAGRVAQEIDLKRLDRVETELMRLENGLLKLETSGQAGNRKFYEQRIAELRKRQEELEQLIIARSESSVELVRPLERSNNFND